MESIAPLLFDWYALHGRDLPWRRTHDPYLIWLSEVILQQTRVAQGMEYYLGFAARWPDAESLAAASEDEVLRVWQGLGYYGRARRLHAAAREVVTRFGGRFPTSFDALRSLPGVGDYTAAAVASIAGGEPCAAVDGNVQRVLARLFDLDVAPDTAVGRRTFATLAQEQLDARRPGTYNQAIMDFGALQCTPAAPRCDDCPFADRCLARAAGTVAQRPVKRLRKVPRERWFHYLHVVCGGVTLLHRRGEGDIWQGLYEFPLIEAGRELGLDELAAADLFRHLPGSAPWRLVATTSMPKHQLTHQTLRSLFFRIELDAWPPLGPEWVRVPVGGLGDYAVPRLIENYLMRQTR